MQKMTLKAGNTGRASITLQARGEHLVLPEFASLGGPLTVQLGFEDGACWESTFATPFKTQKDGRFTAKGQ